MKRDFLWRKAIGEVGTGEIVGSEYTQSTLNKNLWSISLHSNQNLKFMGYLNNKRLYITIEKGDRILHIFTTKKCKIIDLNNALVTLA